MMKTKQRWVMVMAGMILFIGAAGSEGGLVAYWPLNEGSGQVAQDVSGNGNDGVLGSSPTPDTADPGWVVDAERGMALEWEGEAGTLQWVDLTARLDSFRNLTQGTIMVWVKLPGGDEVDTFLAASDSGDESSEIRFIYQLKHGGVIYDVRDDSSNPVGEDGYVTWNGPVTDNQWHHMAVTVDSSKNAIVYVDGEVVATGSEPFFNDVLDLDIMSIGRNVDISGTQWVFQGRMSDMAVFDSVLSGDAIAAVYEGTAIEDLEMLASNLTPAAGATEVPVDTSLTWQSPEGTTNPTYDVYFDTDPAFPTGPLSIQQTVAYLTPLTLLDEATTYYWRVDVRDQGEVYTGARVSFTTDTPGAILTQTDIFIAGQEGYHTYRIPAILRTGAGTLLAFCEGRKNSISDAGDIDIVVKRSSDGGQTWGPLELVYEEGGTATITIGNPCPVVDQSNGRIWLPFCRNNSRVFIGYSDDDGVTWSPRREITSSVKDPTWGWYATGPGVGIQLVQPPYTGRLVIPCDQRLSDNSNYGSHMIYSDDHGATWTYSQEILPGCNECQVVELADGTLMNNMRRYGTYTGYRGVAASEDGGMSWTDPEPDNELVEPTCQASFLRYTQLNPQDKNRVLFSNPAASTRVNMTVKLSYDEGETWPVARQLYSGSSAYSCLAVMGDHSIGCLYERDNYTKITFANFSLEWLTDGADRMTVLGDLSENRIVDFEDVVIMAVHWLDDESPCVTAPTGDLNGDCLVNMNDLSLLISHWLETFNP